MRGRPPPPRLPPRSPEHDLAAAPRRPAAGGRTAAAPSSSSATRALEARCALPGGQSRQVSRAAVFAGERRDDLAMAQIFGAHLRPGAHVSSTRSQFALRARHMVPSRPHDVARRAATRSRTHLTPLPGAARLGMPGCFQRCEARRRRGARGWQKRICDWWIERRELDGGHDLSAHRLRHSLGPRPVTSGPVPDGHRQGQEHDGRDEARPRNAVAGDHVGNQGRLWR